MKSKLLILSLFISLFSFGQKLPINGLCLSDVLAKTGGSCLTTAFTNANAAYFDATYAVSGNCLKDFRNYGAGAACVRPTVGMVNKSFCFAEGPSGEPLTDFTGSFAAASQALWNVVNLSSRSLSAYAGELKSTLAVGDSVYLQNQVTNPGITNCQKLYNGYYFLVPDASFEYPDYVYHIVSGVITEKTMASYSPLPYMYTSEDYVAYTTSIDITSNAVINAGASAVTERGVAWSTSANPTISGSHTHDGSGTGTYNSTMTGLSLNTYYHVRAYGTNSYGTDYGSDMVMLSANISVPTVTTDNACFIDVDNSLAEATVTSDGGATVTGRGFCYSTSNSTPTTADSTQSAGSGTGYFSWSPNGLPQNTNIYVRAYATNSQGTSYGIVRIMNSNNLCN